MNEMKMYITYGKGNEFDASLLHPILRETSFGKPDGCFWGSPVNAKYGWKEWCLSEDFWDISRFEEKIVWILKPHTKVLCIRNYDDIDYFVKKGFIYLDPYNDEYLFSRDNYVINFDKIKRAGYSAIELFDSSIGHRYWKKYDRLFNGWDCESIVVLDPSVIVQVKEED